MLLLVQASFAENPPPSSSSLASAEARYRFAEDWDAWTKAPDRPRIGLALGGGGARGMAHIGVIRALRAANIPIDVVAGTSIGSFIGSLYATGAEINDIEKLALGTNWSNLVELTNSRSGIFSTERLEQFIAFHLRYLKDKDAAAARKDEPPAEVRFQSLPIPFACTATDLHTGEIIRFDSGSVAEAVRASCSIPGLFEPVVVRGRLLVDGGVLLNLPVSVCRSLGAEIVIAVDLEAEPVTDLSGLVQILAQIIRIQGKALTESERNDANFIITPRTGSIKTTDLNNVALAVKEGEIAAQLAVDSLKSQLMGREAGTSVPVSADSVAAWRRTVDSYRGPSFTATVPGNSDQALAAARAASLLGLPARALEILASVPEKQKTREAYYLETLAALRLRDKVRADRAFAAYRALGPNRDRLWQIAAAAIDAGLPELAEAARGELNPATAASGLSGH